MQMLRAGIVLSLLFSLLIFSAAGQGLKFSHVSLDEGLSQSVVECILQDRNGFLWFGTQDGLNRYDGYNFKVFKYNPSDSASISENQILCLTQDKEGKIWIGTNGGGLNRFDPVQGKFTRFIHNDKDPASLPHNTIRAITQDSEGVIWIGTHGGGLSHFIPESSTFKSFQHHPEKPHSISHNAVWSIHDDQKGNLWVGTYGGGLNLFDKKKEDFKTFSIKGDENQGFSNNKIRAIKEDKQGKLWLIFYGGGLCSFNKTTHIFNLKEELGIIAGSKAYSLLIDHNGIFWVGTKDNGIFQIDQVSGKYARHVNDPGNSFSINNNDIKFIIEDRSGSIWFGTNGGGLNIYHPDPNQFRLLNRETSGGQIKSNVILALYEDDNDNLFIGSQNGGLVSYNNKTGLFNQLGDEYTQLHNSITEIFKDREGFLWIGTWGGGLFSLAPGEKKFKNYKNEPGDPATIANNTVFSIFQDDSGNIWIGTVDGLNVLDKSKNNSISTFTTADGLSSNSIGCFLEDDNGILWIGTLGGGLCSFDPNSKKFRSFNKDDSNPNSISNNTVQAIHKDKEGYIWVGTANGLNRFNSKTGEFKRYFSSDGLPNDWIAGILSDNENGIWVSTNKGLSHLTNFIDNNAPVFRNYDLHDGLQGKEFNQDAFYKGSSGRIFFGGINGLNSFYPGKIMDNPVPPEIIITSFNSIKDFKLDSVIEYKRILELPYKYNSFTFEFVALDYIFPGKNQYSFFMEGVDHDWSVPSDRRFASYTKLSGGDYTFHVKACNKDGVWNEKGITIKIHIVPPFWDTWWFYILVIFACVILVFKYINFRTRKIEQEKRILETKVEERTMELAQKNKDITSSIEYARRIQDAILPSQDLIFRQLPNAFILYKPKDIVSGDFYWFAEKNGIKILAAVDCTGHGVPGAFMSMIGHNLLNQIVIQNGITRPSEILNLLNKGVQDALKQGKDSNVQTRDGMDLSLCSFNTAIDELEFAGAYRPLIKISGGKMEKIDGDNFPIGGADGEGRKFTNHTRKMSSGETVYMFTDGYADQFGGKGGKKFMTKRFYQLLIENQALSMNEQAVFLNKTIMDWSGGEEQVDDILVIGMRF